MKRHQFFVSAVVIFIVVFFTAVMWARVIWMPKAMDLVTTAANEKLNGTLSFSDMRISLTGKLVFTDIAVRDIHGRNVLEGKEADISFSPFRMLRTVAAKDDIFAGIDTIDIEKPVLHVWKDEKTQSWNVLNIFRKQADKQSVTLRSNIVIHDGIFRVAPDNTKTLTVGDINGSVSLTDFPTVKGDLDATIDGKAVSLSVRCRSAREYDVKVRGDEIPLSYAAPFIPADTDIRLTGGRAEQFYVHLSQSRRGFSLSGQGEITDGALTFKDYLVDSVSGHVSVTDTDVFLKDVSGNINGQTVAVRGEIKAGGDVPVVNLTVDADGADLAELTKGRNIDITGTAGYHGNVWGRTDDLNMRGKLTANNIGVAGLAIDTLFADVAYIRHVGTVDKLNAVLCGGTVAAQGIWRSDTGELRAIVHGESLRLEAVPYLSVGISGIVSGDAVLGGSVGDLNSIAAAGRLTGNALSYNGMTVDSGSCDFLYTGGIINITGINGTLRGGTVTGNAVYDTNTGISDGDLIADDIPFDVFSGVSGVSLDGTVSALLRFSGAEPVWSMDFNGTDGTVNGMGFDNIYGSLRGSGKNITVNTLTCRYKDGTYRAAGQVDLDSRNVDLHVETEHCRLEQILLAAGRDDWRLTGWIDNVADVRGTLDDPIVTGRVNLSSGSAKGYLYQHVSADYRFHDGTVYITDGTAEAYNALLHFSGSVGDRLDLDIVGSDLETDRFIRRDDISLAGALTLKAHVGGTTDNPSVGGTLRAAALTVNAIRIDNVTGDFSYGGGILRLHKFGFTQDDGTYEAELMHNTVNDRIAARASVKDGSLENIIMIAKAPLTKVTGRLDGDIIIDGTLHNPNARIKGRITQGMLDDHPVDPSDIDVSFEEGVLHVDKLALNAAGGILAAQGTYALHGPVDIQVAAKNFSTKILQDVLNENSVPVDSRIDFALNVSGTGDAPVAEGSIQLNGGTLNGVAFTEAFALFNIKNGIVTLNQASLTRSPYKATALGTIPLAALRDDTRDGSINVVLKLDDAGLDGLTFITPYVEKADGALAGKVTVSGTVQNPQLNGNVTVRNGYAKIKGIVNPLANVNGDLVFKGNSVTLNSHGTMDKSGRDDKGYYDIQGSAAWSGTTVTDYRITFSAHDLNLDCTYYKGPLNGSLSVSKDGDLPLVGGSVDVNKATIDVPLSLVMSESDFDCALDLAVTAGNKVRFYNSGLYDVWITGDAVFRGTLNQPYASGHFEVSHGSIRYLDTRFTITEGRADFQGNSFIPAVNMAANTRIGQYAVFLNLNGRADSMNMTFRSDPPLTRAQIVSLITLRNGNKRDSSLDSQDVNSLVGSGIRFTLNSLGVTQKLEDVLSLDMLTVTTGNLDITAHDREEGKNYYNIEMGKYLFNNFMVTAAFGLNHNDNRIGMQYNLGSRFSVDAWKSPDNAYVGGSWRYSF